MEFPYGKIVAIPSDFAPPETWPEYGTITNPPPVCSRESVGERPQGIRWSLWPLTFEQYCSDKEPDLERSKQGRLARNRQIIWHRIGRTDIPKGWRASSSEPSQVDGFRILTEEVTDGWNKNARRELRLWQEQYADKTHRIERIEFPEYQAAYDESLIAKRVNKDRVRILARKLKLPEVAAHTELWGVRDLSSKRIVAGTAIIHSPTYKSSTHFAPFIHAEARHIYAATALIHHWFALAQARGDTYVLTTNFWFPGKEASWKGFSEFKSHFGWQYIAYPPELTRFVKGKLF
jgi:hypothetical protein